MGCNGTAAVPCSSMLLSMFVVIVIYRSVDLNRVPDSETSIKTQLRIGKVDLFGTALDNFCSADCSSFLEVEYFFKWKKSKIRLKVVHSGTKRLF